MRAYLATCRLFKVPHLNTRISQEYGYWARPATEWARPAVTQEQGARRKKQGVRMWMFPKFKPCRSYLTSCSSPAPRPHLSPESALAAVAVVEYVGSRGHFPILQLAGIHHLYGTIAICLLPNCSSSLYVCIYVYIHIEVNGNWNG